MTHEEIIRLVEKGWCQPEPMVDYIKQIEAILSDEEMDFFCETLSGLIDWHDRLHSGRAWKQNLA